MANVALDPIELRPGRIDRGFRRGEWTELIQGSTVAGKDIGVFQIAPYQVMWRAGSRFEPGG